MKIKCNKYGEIIDIKSSAAIIFYLKQGEIICNKCGNTIYLSGGEND